jgi:hypothetical protein
LLDGIGAKKIPGRKNFYNKVPLAAENAGRMLTRRRNASLSKPDKCLAVPKNLRLCREKIRWQLAEIFQANSARMRKFYGCD